MLEQNSVHNARENWRDAQRLNRFNARIGLLISGEIEALGDEMMPEDKPDGGDPAVLNPLDLPPRISNIALRRPGQEPLVDLNAG